MDLHTEIDCTVKLALHEVSDDDVGILTRIAKGTRREVTVLWTSHDTCALNVDYANDLDGARALVSKAEELADNRD